MKNKFILIVFILFVTLLVHTDELTDSYLEQASAFFILKDYKKAYTYINFVLRYYEDGKADWKVYKTAEEIYFEYLKVLMEKNEIKTIKEVTINLSKYPDVSSQRIIELFEKAKNKLKKEKERKEKEEEIKRKIEEKRLIEEEEKRRELEKAKTEEEKKEKELERRLREKEMEHKLILAQKEKEIAEDRRKDRKLEEILLEKELKDEKEREEFNKTLMMVLNSKEKGLTSNKTIIFIVIFFGFIFFVFMVIFLISLRHSHRQQQKIFEYSMRTIQQPQNLLSIPSNETSEKEAKMLEDKSNIKDSISYREDMLEFKSLLEKCRSYSVLIDEVTDRKNCSRNVAELIYKVSINLGYSEIDSMTYYAVGLIYDIGFLNIDQEILKRKEVSEKQFDIIKSHTSLGLNLINFVGDNYQDVFKDGISKHHEHLDGSGYPEGIKEKDIPYIAKVIRIIESYIALTSTRKNKKILDKEKAIKELFNEKNKYDEKILNELKEVV